MRQYRYFFLFIHAQQTYLNRMATKGYRLTHCGIAAYDFEKSTEPVEYQIEYIADQSAASYRRYLALIEELGYTSFLKNINLNYTAGRMKLRFTGHGLHMQTSKDLINHELLIIEKPLGTSLDAYTTYEDQLHYLTSLRNIYLQYVIFLLFMIILFMIKLSASMIWLTGLALLCFLTAFIAVIRSELQIHKLKQEHTLFE